MGLDLVLLIIAALCFIVAALGLPVNRINLVALGLFFWVLSTIIH